MAPSPRRLPALEDELGGALGLDAGLEEVRAGERSGKDGEEWGHREERGVDEKGGISTLPREWLLGECKPTGADMGLAGHHSKWLVVTEMPSGHKNSVGSQKWRWVTETSLGRTDMALGRRSHQWRWVTQRWRWVGGRASPT